MLIFKVSKNVHGVLWTCIQTWRHSSLEIRLNSEHMNSTTGMQRDSRGSIHVKKATWCHQIKKTPSHDCFIIACFQWSVPDLVSTCYNSSESWNDCDSVQVTTGHNPTASFLSKFRRFNHNSSTANLKIKSLSHERARLTPITPFKSQ